MLVRMAARHGCTLTIGRMQGGLFETMHLYDVRWRQNPPVSALAETGTDVRVAHAELTFAWRVPWLQKPAPSALRRLTLAGITGRLDLAPPPVVSHHSGTRSWPDRVSPRLVPTEFFLQGDDFTLLRNRFRLRFHHLRLSGERHSVGWALAREVEIAGPGFANTLLNRHGQTVWQDHRLSIRNLELGPGVQLVNATLDGTHLNHQRLDWEGNLTATGGEIRGQGAVNFVHPRLALEVAGSLRRMPVPPLARLLGLTGPAGGLVEQGSFSFRGDPEDWSSAQMWLAAQATDFRWGRRDWQSLDIRATILHRRVQVSRLELQQSRNRVSLTGECPLPTSGQLEGRWWEPGFACNVDARLDDLPTLAQLFGTRLPVLDGRMSINGALEAMPGRPGISGYLNVEGSRLQIRGAPLDYLRSTLLFRGDDLNVADVQATRGADYFSGRGSVSLTGASHYRGELRLAVADPAVYASALGGMVDLEEAGLPVAEAATPVRWEGLFYGPNPEGKAVFLTFGDLLQAVEPAQSTNSTEPKDPAR